MNQNLPGLTHAEIAKRLGISPVRVRELERRALVKLRRGLEKLGIKSARPPSPE
jgi:DNA-directed RNA polymerase specialized sigma24 family protein